ncbi:acyl-CoA thioesterase [Spongiibacter sp. KMU-166]|uniref:Acyl-CoA thioesterase n=1 Tax=Spongiibacter thalassae TaxID=2721624 RepID=A0ABX1GH24_9GAMM|nr:thioesterase family protein [Spongiibacter thalassae]NKI18514.1 acyl-CoA thioesterase [Spongiibacter thalassae]
MSDDTLLRRDHYHWFTPITLRWMDNDVYGHANNVNYYSWFDTTANTFLIEQGGLDIHHGKEIGYIVHSECFYRSAVAFPDTLDGALRVNRLGNSSVEYGLAIFRQGEDTAAAHGRFTHVFVNRETEKPVPISGSLRDTLASLMSS